jgi:hypothetical protein
MEHLANTIDWSNPQSGQCVEYLDGLVFLTEQGPRSIYVINVLRFG